MSPEQLGERLGVSGMTLRRWKELPAQGEIPKLYQKAILEVVFQLCNEGRLSNHSRFVQEVVRQSGLESFQAVIKDWGVSQEKEGVIFGLSQIGASEHRKQEVDQSHKKILSFKKMGPEWASRIKSLLQVVTSKRLTAFEKLAAYGALFYLINPFDLIPDHFAPFGLIDDFGVLGLATAYYATRALRNK